MKVERLGNLNTQGLTQGKNLVYQEKIDGSNFRIANIDGNTIFGSRNLVVTDTDKNFGKAVRLCRNNIDIEKIPVNMMVIGEWLKPHTIKYYENSYEKFYMFDVLDLNTGCYLPFEKIETIAKEIGAELINVVYIGEWQGLEHLKSLITKSKYGDDLMEGIVIKSDDFKNKFGRQCHAKFVRDSFSEVQGVKCKKINLENYDTENTICEIFITLPRLLKMIERGGEDGKDITMDMKMMSFIPKYMLNDILEEESYHICTNYDRVDFKILKKILPRHVAKLLTKFLNEKDTG